MSTYLQIRDIRNSDRKEIKNIAKVTWEGFDYLDKVFDLWLKDGNFFALEVDKKVIGSVKMTYFPEGVIWLEGLRVHRDFQKKGYGKILYNFINEKALKSLKKSKKFKYIEFSTYYKNIESLTLAKKDKFKIINKYFIIGKEIDKNFKQKGRIFKENISKVIEYSPKINDFYSLKLYGEYIPLGWEFVKNSTQSIKWLKNKAVFCRYKDTIFFYPRADVELTYTPFKLEYNYIKNIIPGLSAKVKAHGSNYISLMIPGEYKSLVKELKKLGFKTWTKRMIADVVICRKFDL